jgi:hypothetical protein
MVGLPIPHSLRRSAWVNCATATPVGGLSLLAVLIHVADKHPAAYAGVGALQASVVRLYGVVVIVSGWVSAGCARLSGVHEAPPRGPGPGVCPHLRDLFFIRHTYLTYILYIYDPFMVHFQEKVMRAKWIGDGYNASRGLYRRQAQSFTD